MYVLQNTYPFHPFQCVFSHILVLYFLFTHTHYITNTNLIYVYFCEIESIPPIGERYINFHDFQKGKYYVLFCIVYKIEIRRKMKIVYDAISLKIV